MVKLLSHERISKYKINLYQELTYGVYEAARFDEVDGRIIKDPHRILYIVPSCLVFSHLHDEMLICDASYINYPNNIDEVRAKSISDNKKVVANWPDNVRKALTDKNTHVYIDHAIEGWSNIRFSDVCSILGIPRSRIRWITSLYGRHNNAPLGENSIYRNWWETILKDNLTIKNTDAEQQRLNFENQIKLCENKHKRNKLCTSYMRRIRVPRLIMALMLKDRGLLNNMYWSLGVKVDGETSVLPFKNTVEMLRDDLRKISFKEQLSDETFDSFLEIEENVTCDDNTLVDNLAAGFITWDHVFDTKFMLINETIPKHLGKCEHPYTPFLSEKIYKPFVSGQPFVVHGCAGTVAALREQNYFTFDDFIRHDDYDNIQCPVQRANAVANEVERLNKIPDNTWQDYLYDIAPHLRHNYEVIMKSKDIVTTLYDYNGDFFKF